MYIKRYTVLSMLFIILLGWYVYGFVTQESANIELFGITLPSLSIAFLVVIPVFLLYVASVLHISFYSILGSLRLRKDRKDYERLLETIVDIYLQKGNKHTTFQTQKYQLLATLIDNTTIVPTQEIQADTSHEKINTVIKLINDIKEGNVVDLRKYALSSSNPLVIQNDKNRYTKGDISAEDIVSNSEKYDISISSQAYKDLVKTCSLSTIKKYKKLLNKESLLEILKRVNGEKNTLNISNAELIDLFNQLDLTSKEFIQASSALSSMIPEKRMKLFETLSEENEKAMDGYLFTLFDLEMLAPADEILESSRPSEYLNFKSYRALKECNKHFNINLFV